MMLSKEITPRLLYAWKIFVQKKKSKPRRVEQLFNDQLLSSFLPDQSFRYLLSFPLVLHQFLQDHRLQDHRHPEYHFNSYPPGNQSSLCQYNPKIHYWYHLSKDLGDFLVYRRRLFAFHWHF